LRTAVADVIDPSAKRLIAGIPHAALFGLTSRGAINVMGGNNKKSDAQFSREVLMLTHRADRLLLG